MMKRMSWLAMAAGLALAACGGSSSGGGSHKVGGTVAGLTSDGLVLQNNGGDDLTVAANATTFQFPVQIAQGKPYAVTVLTQPSGSECTVANGSGTMGNADVTNVAVTCAAGASVSTTVAGLAAGQSVVLTGTFAGAATDATVTANGPVADLTRSVPPGTAYSIVVKTQPSRRATCAVAPTARGRPTARCPWPSPAPPSPTPSAAPSPAWEAPPGSASRTASAPRCSPSRPAPRATASPRPFPRARPTRWRWPASPRTSLARWRTRAAPSPATSPTPT